MQEGKPTEHTQTSRVKQTGARKRPVWNPEATDSTDPITIEQHLKIRTDAANVYLQTRAHRRILELYPKSKSRPHRISLGSPVCIWRDPKTKKQSGPRWNGNWIGPARILAHQRRADGRLGRIVWCVHNTNLYRAAPEHIRPATRRDAFLREVHLLICCPVNLSKCCNMDKFLMVSGQTCWTKSTHLISASAPMDIMN